MSETIPEADVERVARAIYEANDPTSGDAICTTLHVSEFITGATVPEQLEEVMGICRSAALAAIEAMQPALLSAERRGAEREREIATLDYTWDVICDRLSVKRGSDAFTVISAIEKVKAASIASAIRKGAS